LSHGYHEDDCHVSSSKLLHLSGPFYLPRSVNRNIKAGSFLYRPISWCVCKLDRFMSLVKKNRLWRNAQLKTYVQGGFTPAAVAPRCDNPRTGTPSTSLSAGAVWGGWHDPLLHRTSILNFIAMEMELPCKTPPGYSSGLPEPVTDVRFSRARESSRLNLFLQDFCTSTHFHASCAMP
jgi:hypothetical protein